jgi:hypothetical protein
VLDGEVRYPLEWTGGVFIPGAYVLIACAGDLTINSGWETTFSLPRNEVSPHICTAKFGTIGAATGARGSKMKKGGVTTGEMKKFKSLVIAGEYVAPYKKESKVEKQKAEKRRKQIQTAKSKASADTADNSEDETPDQDDD